MSFSGKMIDIEPVEIAESDMGSKVIWVRREEVSPAACTAGFFEYSI